MLSRLKQLFIAALFVSARAAGQSPSLTGAFKTDRLDEHGSLTRHYLHPDPDFPTCMLDYSTYFLHTRKAVSASMSYLTDQPDIFDNNPLIFGTCDEQGNTILHTLAQAGNLNKFTEALSKAPTPLLAHRNHQGKSLTDLILASQHHDLLIPLFIATEKEQTVVSAFLFNQQLKNKYSKKPTARNYHQYLLQSLAVNKYIKPQSEAGKALHQQNKAKILMHPDGHLLMLDFDTLYYNFDTVLTQLEQLKLTSSFQPTQASLANFEQIMTRLAKAQKPYREIRQWSLLETLTMVQSLPSTLPYTSKTTPKLNDILLHSKSYFHEDALWKFSPDAYQDYQASVTEIAAANEFMFREKPPTNAELDEGVRIADAIIARYEHLIEARRVLDNAITLKANIYHYRNNPFDATIFHYILQLQILRPGGDFKLEKFLKNAYESNFHPLPPAEALLATRLLLSQSFFDTWDKKAEVLQRYKSMLNDYKPEIHGFPLSEYNILDASVLEKHYGKEAKAIIRQERNSLEKYGDLAGYDVDRETINRWSRVLDIVFPVLLIGLTYYVLMRALVSRFERAQNFPDNLDALYVSLNDICTAFIKPYYSGFDFNSAVMNQFKDIESACSNNVFDIKFIPENVLIDTVQLDDLPRAIYTGKKRCLTTNKTTLAMLLNQLISTALICYESVCKTDDFHERKQAIEKWENTANQVIHKYWADEVKQSPEQKAKKAARIAKQKAERAKQEALPQMLTPSPEEKERLRLREAALQLQAAKEKLNYTRVLSTELIPQFGKLPNCNFSIIEEKVQTQAEHVKIKQLLHKLQTMFTHLDKVVAEENSAKVELIKHQANTDDALNSDHIDVVQQSSSALEAAYHWAKTCLALTKTKINAIHAARTELQTTFHELTDKAKEVKLTQPAIKPKQSAEKVQRHLSFLEQQAHKKGRAAAPKAIPAHRHPSIDITDEIGIPLLKAQEALHHLERMDVAAEFLSATGLIALNVFIYTQLFEALARLAQTPLHEYLPSHEDLSTFRNQFAHQFQHIRLDFIAWVALATECRETFSPLIEHFMGDQTAQPVPLPARLPQPLLHIFDDTSPPNHLLGLPAIKADYQALSDWVQHQQITDVNAPAPLALRGMIILLNELTDTPVLKPYRNQDAHIDLQTDMSVETLLNLKKAISKINIKSARGPKLFNPRDEACHAENLPLRVRPRGKRT